MNVALRKLIAIIPPPKRPIGVGSAERWARTEATLGTALPEDYRQFVHAYGARLFAGFYLINTPGSKGSHSNLVEYHNLIAPSIMSYDSFDLEYDIHPTRPGLLTWGHDENGHRHYWLTKGKPDHWTVVAESVRGSGFVQHDCSMVKYLLGVQQLKIRPLASGYPPLKMRCPSELCTGYARGAHGLDEPWSCDECATEWDDRESFEEEVAEVIRKRPYRKASYLRKRGHYYPAPREQEHPHYARLVRREIDDD